MAREGSGSLKAWEDLDIGQLAVRTVTTVLKRRPVTVSLWVLGLLLAAFAKGFTVDDTTREAYMFTLQHAEEVDIKELNKVARELQKADAIYYNAKGWFWSCDAKCKQAWDKVSMARAEVSRVQLKRERILTDAKREVGIWSTFGVREVRNNFWSAWQSGKDFAARYTMMDALFIMIGGQEESMVSVMIKIAFQYIMNLTVGLVGAFFYFIYNVYVLVGSYGEPFLSGLSFFLLVMVAGAATVGTYLFAIYGTVAGGGLLLMKHAAKQAAVEGGRPGARPRPRPVQYGQYGGGPVGGRTHFD